MVYHREEMVDFTKGLVGIAAANRPGAAYRACVLQLLPDLL
jgi:hypothetical protein